MQSPARSVVWTRALLCAATMLLAAAAAFAVTPRPVADVPIPMASGKPLNLKQYRGKVVLLAVISRECDDCIKSIDILNRLQKELGPRGFQVIAAVGDPNAQYLIDGFVRRYHPAFPVGFLSQDQIIQITDLGKNAQHAYVPIFMFIDRKGTVRHQASGNEPFFKNEESLTRQTVQDLLK